MAPVKRYASGSSMNSRAISPSRVPESESHGVREKNKSATNAGTIDGTTVEARTVNDPTICRSSIETPFTLVNPASGAQPFLKSKV
jgi:hypothetical protein